jgi:hypothetical protein
MVRHRQLHVTDWLTTNAAVLRGHGGRVSAFEELGNETEDEYVALRWPDGIIRLSSCLNPKRITFQDEPGNGRRCVCKGTCLRGLCDNAAGSIYCDDGNCGAGEHCGNRWEEFTCLKLVRTSTGIGLATTVPLPPETCVGEYGGLLRSGSAFTPAMRRHGYGFEFSEMDVKEKRVIVDATRHGSLFRFINHSCVPNCRFEVMMNGSERKVAVVTIEYVPAEGELTVRYCKHVWFVCRCEACMCARFALKLPLLLIRPM